MKFYFCEKCGARLTDADVAEGRARNKRLRGVFCSNCAAGVLTLEVLPITDAQAEALKQAQAPPQAPAEPAAPPRARAAAARRMPERETRAGSGSSGGMYAALAAGALGVLVLVFLLFGGNSKTPVSSASGPTPVRAPEAAPAPKPVADSASPKPVASPIAEAPLAPPEPDGATPAALSDEDRAREAFEKLEAAVAGMPADALSAKREAIERYLAAHGTTIVASRARHLLRQLEAPAPTPAPTPVPASAGAAKTVAAASEAKSEPADPPDGLVGHWTFDEGQGATANDQSAVGGHAQISGGVTWVPGVKGGALEFNGSDGWLKVASKAQHNLSGRDFTVALWADFEKGGYLMVAKGKSGWRGWNFDALQFGICDRTGPATVLKLDVPKREAGRGWTHLAVTLQLATREMTGYVNGQAAGRITLPDSLNLNDINDGSLWFGRRDVLVKPLYTGKLDEIRLYRRALSAEELGALYRADAPK